VLRLRAEREGGRIELRASVRVRAEREEAIVNREGARLPMRLLFPLVSIGGLPARRLCCIASLSRISFSYASFSRKYFLSSANHACSLSCCRCSSDRTER